MTTRRFRRLVAALVIVATIVGTAVVVGTSDRTRRSTDDGTAAVDSSTTTGASTSTSTPSATSTASTTTPSSSVDATAPVKVEPAAYAAVDANGTAPVIVMLDLEPSGTDAERSEQVRIALDRVLATLPPGSYADVRKGYTVPVVPITVDRSGLEALDASTVVDAVRASRTYQPAETGAGPSVAPSVDPSSTNATTTEGAPIAWAAGKRGTGAAVAVIDTGVDVTHPFLTATPKTFWEACFASGSAGGYVSPCPGGVPMTSTSAPAPGSAKPCPVSASSSCTHGTHVAGIAAGGTGTPGTPVSGIAPDADLVAINVFSVNPSIGRVSANDGDILTAMQWLYNKRALFPGLASVNLSLGDNFPQSGSCDSDYYKYFVDLLASVGIATVIAAGNDGSSTGVSSPGCVSGAFTVAAVDDATGQRTSYSNVGPQVAVMAAGGEVTTATGGICSSVLTGSTRTPCPAPNGGTMQYMSGTSMATPAVSGAIALLRADSVPFIEWRARVQRVASGGDCVQAAVWTIPSLRVDVALGLTAQAAAPCAPSYPSASLVSASSATVSWRAPIALGTGTLTSYTATASTGQSCTASDPATTCTVVGLPTASAITFTVRANSTAGTSGPSIATEPVATTMVAPLTPARIADTRSPAAWGSTIDGLYLGRGPIPGGTSWSVKVLGRGGVPNSGVGAVALNVTATQPTASSFLTVWPSLTARPTASNLNFVTGQTVPNLVIVGVGGDGSVAIFNALGATEVIVDVVGWYPALTGYSPVAPARLLDTRPGFTTIDGLFNGTGAIGNGATLSLTVAGRGGVPAGAGSVVLNVTAVEPTVPGFLTIFPTGSSRPLASNLNFVAGQVVANSVVAEVGAGGRIDIFNPSGSTNVVVDVLGWMPAVGQFHAMSPARLLDTRPGYSTVDGQESGVGPIGWGTTLVLPVEGRIGIPADAYAVVVNVTAIAPTIGGYFTVYPSGVARPTASNLNFVAGQVVPNLVVTGLGADGRIAIFNFSGSTNAVVDIVGWYA